MRPSDTGSMTNWLPLLREALASVGRFRFPLRGTSMRPTLPRESIIEIVPLPPQVPLGSLIVFANNDALVANRLVARAKGRWIAQGDARLAPDRPLDPEQVLGLVQAACCGDRRCWPKPGGRLLAAFWVARYWLLRPLRGAWRFWAKTLRVLAG